MTVDCAFQGKKKSIANPWVREKYKGGSIRKADTPGKKELHGPVLLQSIFIKESRSLRVKIF